MVATWKFCQLFQVLSIVPWWNRYKLINLLFTLLSIIQLVYSSLCDKSILCVSDSECLLIIIAQQFWRKSSKSAFNIAGRDRAQCTWNNWAGWLSSVCFHLRYFNFWIVNWRWSRFHFFFMVMTLINQCDGQREKSEVKHKSCFCWYNWGTDKKWLGLVRELTSI